MQEQHKQKPELIQGSTDEFFDKVNSLAPDEYGGLNSFDITMAQRLALRVSRQREEISTEQFERELVVLVYDCQNSLQPTDGSMPLPDVITGRSPEDYQRFYRVSDSLAADVFGLSFLAQMQEYRKNVEDFTSRSHT